MGHSKSYDLLRPLLPNTQVSHIMQNWVTSTYTRHSVSIFVNLYLLGPETVLVVLKGYR